MEGGNPAVRTLRWLPAALGLALACAVLWPAHSQAFVGCSNSGGTLRVTVNQSDDTVSIARGGDAINVIAEGSFGQGPNILLVCSGGSATVNNTDLVSVEGAAVARDAEVDFVLGSGPLGPGATPEPDGASEIELRASLFGQGSAVGVQTGGGNDVIHFGRLANGATGANLNPASEAVADVDLEVAGAQAFAVSTGAGRDMIRGRGAPGFAGPMGGRTVLLALGGAGRDELIAGHSSSLLSGGSGGDRILGSQHADFVEAGRGRDLVKTGRGRDLVFAAKGGRDRVNCGGGNDSALVDERDRARGCERRSASFREIINKISGGGGSARSLSRTADVLRRK